MHFQIACKHCQRPFIINAERAQTVKCNCPYCGQEMTVATPSQDLSPTQSSLDEPANVMENNVKSDVDTNKLRVTRVRSSNIGRTVTLIFVLCLFGIILLSSLLYVIFSAMSN